ncbi:MAG: glycosyltransferase [Myxococcota bacterium]
MAAEVGGRPHATPDQRLVELRAHRRPIDRERLRVLAFGANQWERHGLWQAFASHSDFHLSEYGDGRAESIGADEDGGERRASHRRGFLQKLDELERERPVDVVFIYASGEHLDDELFDALAERRIWTVIMALDDKHQFTRPLGKNGVPHQLRAALRCDLYWTTWRLAAAVVGARGGAAWVAPEAADPSFHRFIQTHRDIDILFVGAAYGRRRELVEYLRARGLSVSAFGRGWPDGFVDFEKTIELYNRARIVLGVGDVGHMAGVKHLKGRDFEVPMTGALYLTSFNAELTEHFVVGQEILCYGSFEECAELAIEALASPGRAEEVRLAGKARALRDHTWQRRVGQLLDLLASA